MKRAPYLLMALALSILLHAQGVLAGSAPPRVVVSIKPLHSLVAGVMRGVGAPHLLIRGATSPHTFSLKPSDARAIEDAQLIFWVGESLAPALKRPLEVLPRRARVVAMAQAEGVEALRVRTGGLWEAHAHHHDAHGGAGDHEAHKHREADHGHDEDKHKEAEHDHDGHKHKEHGHDEDKHKEDEHGHHADRHRESGHDHGEEDRHGRDAHVWLDPRNARAWVGAIAHELGAADPRNRGKYEANARALGARLDRLHQELKAALAPVRDAPYIVFHDAYQYLERRYGLNAIGSVSLSPEKQPGAARLVEIRRKIRATKSVCVFTEPQFRSGLVETIIRGTDARTGALDPLGASVPAGEDAYFTLLRTMAQSLRACLLRRS